MTSLSEERPHGGGPIWDCWCYTVDYCLRCDCWTSSRGPQCADGGGQQLTDRCFWDESDLELHAD